jgi:hypothetical protein
MTSSAICETGFHPFLPPFQFNFIFGLVSNLATRNLNLKGHLIELAEAGLAIFRTMSKSCDLFMEAGTSWDAPARFRNILIQRKSAPIQPPSPLDLDWNH